MNISTLVSFVALAVGGVCVFLMAGALPCAAAVGFALYLRPLPIA